MHAFRRSGIAAAVIASSALIAIGCGGSDSDAASAAKDSQALDMVPATALGYATVDIDFDGEGWKQFDKLATAFDADFKGIQDVLADESTGDDDDSDLSWKEDFEPWAGDSAGGAVTTVSADGKSAKGFVWVDVKDKAEFEKFAKREDYKADGKVGDFDVWVDEDDAFFGVKDDLLILATERKTLDATATFDGDSITGVDGLDNVVDEAEGDSLATLVVNGAGVRDALKDNEQYATIAKAVDLKDFTGMSVTFAAKDNGLSVHGYVQGLSKDGKNSGNELFRSLPENTLLAIGAQDLGGGIKSAVDSAGKDNAQVQQVVGGLAGVLGVDIDDLAEALKGEFALAVSADDAALGALAGGVAGAAMGGGLGGINPAALTKSGNVTLAFENEDTTVETLDKVAAAVGGLTGSAPVTGTSGDFETKTFTVSGLPITAASSDEVAAISIGQDVFTNWGDTTLADSDTFKDAWAAADAPDDVAASFWLDWSRVSGLLDVKGSNKMEAGGWVGWLDADGDAVSFDVFMHVDEA
ncbi:MAG: hypothetical protein JWM25_349 [Thermoleophilia bacterium]|nr:hypothetical protein [Thermoleophilia bacterium]